MYAIVYLFPLRIPKNISFKNEENISFMPRLSMTLIRKFDEEENENV